MQMGEENPFAALFKHWGLPEQCHTHMAPESHFKLATIAGPEADMAATCLAADTLHSTWAKHWQTHQHAPSKAVKKLQCVYR
jgi:hypothetical protein